eukprot:557104-Rhodomonas_salina.2
MLFPERFLKVVGTTPALSLKACNKVPEDLHLWPGWVGVPDFAIIPWRRILVDEGIEVGQTLPKTGETRRRPRGKGKRGSGAAAGDASGNANGDATVGGAAGENVGGAAGGAANCAVTVTVTPPLSPGAVQAIFTRPRPGQAFMRALDALKVAARGAAD